MFTDEPTLPRIVWLFSMVLGCSRLIWARYVMHQDLPKVLRCHGLAFAAIGGVPREILCDRMKTAVIGEGDGEGFVYNRSLIDLAHHFGFHPRACRPYRAKSEPKFAIGPRTMASGQGGTAFPLNSRGLLHGALVPQSR